MKKSYNLLLAMTCSMLMVATSCGNQETTTEEKVEINTMDSTSRALDDATDKMEDQTKKVEASLEKLDKEFENSND